MRRLEAFTLGLFVALVLPALPVPPPVEFLLAVVVTAIAGVGLVRLVRDLNVIRAQADAIRSSDP